MSTFTNIYLSGLRAGMAKRAAIDDNSPASRLLDGAMGKVRNQQAEDTYKTEHEGMMDQLTEDLNLQRAKSGLPPVIKNTPEWQQYDFYNSARTSLANGGKLRPRATPQTGAPAPPPAGPLREPLMQEPPQHDPNAAPLKSRPSTTQGFSAKGPGGSGGVDTPGAQAVFNSPHATAGQSGEVQKMTMSSGGGNIPGATASLGKGPSLLPPGGGDIPGATASLGKSPAPQVGTNKAPSPAGGMGQSMMKGMGMALRSGAGGVGASIADSMTSGTKKNNNLHNQNTMSTFTNIYLNGLRAGMAKQAASLNDKALASIVPPNTTKVIESLPNMAMDKSGPVMQMLSKVLNDPIALGAAAGGTAGVIHGAVAPGRDEQGKRKSRVGGALTHGAVGAAGGAAIGLGAGAAGRHGGILDSAMLQNFNPDMQTLINSTGKVTQTIKR